MRALSSTSPDRCAADSSSARAATDCGSRATAGSACMNKRMPCSDSAVVTGVRSFEYRPSTQWASPFMPVDSISAAGTVTLACGSITISRQASLGSLNKSLRPSSVRTPTLGVTSAAEAVQGTAATGSFGWRSSGATSVAGGVKRLAHCSSSPPSASHSAAALALSAALPPPTATKPSHCPARARSRICVTAATDECAGTLVNSANGTPSSASSAASDAIAPAAHTTLEAGLRCTKDSTLIRVIPVSVGIRERSENLGAVPAAPRRPAGRPSAANRRGIGSLGISTSPR